MTFVVRKSLELVNMTVTFVFINTIFMHLNDLQAFIFVSQ